MNIENAVCDWENELIASDILIRVAELMLALVFVLGGIATLRNPRPRSQRLARFRFPFPLLLVRLNAVVMIIAGLALALNIIRAGERRPGSRSGADDRIRSCVLGRRRNRSAGAVGTFHQESRSARRPRGNDRRGSVSLIR